MTKKIMKKVLRNQMKRRYSQPEMGWSWAISWAMPSVKGLITAPAKPAAAPRKGIAVPTSES